MSVIVKGVNVPKNCYTCAKYRWSSLCPCWHGDAQASYYRTSRHPDCPIVEVPPHGRLIDADAFDERVRVAGGMSEEELTEDFKDGVQAVLYMLSKQQTIIEAEGSENENHNV